MYQSLIKKYKKKYFIHKTSENHIKTLSSLVTQFQYYHNFYISNIEDSSKLRQIMKTQGFEFKISFYNLFTDAI